MTNLTVLIPIYNTPPEYLMKAVNSIIEQDISIKPKIILIDDGSDNIETLKMIEFYSRKCCIFHQTNGGTSKALNAGHRLVETEWVAIMGSDDISFSSRLSMQMDYLHANPNTDVVGTNLEAFYTDKPHEIIFTTKHLEHPLPHKNNPNWYVNHGTVIYRQEAVIACGGYNEQKGRGQDIELWERMAKAGYIFRNLPSILYQWRRYRK